MTLHVLIPRTVAGHPIDYSKADPETGEIDVVIWRDARRDDGFSFTCRDWRHVFRLIREIEASAEGRQ